LYDRIGVFWIQASLGEPSISTFFICDKWIAVFHLLRSSSKLHDPSGSSLASISVVRDNPIRSIFWTLGTSVSSNQYVNLPIEIFAKFKTSWDISEVEIVHCSKESMNTVTINSPTSSGVRPIKCIFYVYITLETNNHWC
jgi:hypothetical protein